MEGNFKMKKVRAVILARKMPTEPDLRPTKYLKGYKSYGAHKNVVYGRTGGWQYDRYIPTYSVRG